MHERLIIAENRCDFFGVPNEYFMDFYEEQDFVKPAPEKWEVGLRFREILMKLIRKMDLNEQPFFLQYGGAKRTVGGKKQTATDVFILLR